MFHEPEESAILSKSDVLLTSFVSGALAGILCDVTLFPLDTLKTRLQSQHGFFQSGGFKQLYKGVGPVILGSAPSAAIFFITYEGIKQYSQPHIPDQYHSIIHMIAASSSEVTACLVRVPVEVVKQRKQALLADTHRLALRTLYRGYGSTVLRDMPFGLIQMPLWEYFKLCWTRQIHRECSPLEGATCGAASVAISAAITTPLDVAKTRIMLSSTSAEKEEVKISMMLKEVYRDNGAKGLFAGFTPRVTGFTIGGFIFFGVYEKARELCISYFTQ
ncbi:PREDICTED: S-adenosylmethionine mitochondrial carrier protein-like isoform X1 [Dinoponera quadriceps]|uniref:S-adenosylmethionine mitochondrial carrier protein-like isoform X1 n=1 Tax=Dinoponera quadriceps TaxID=609295 RepID=A0A6P3Y3Q6_DINQU|nr:PREDICTED: S-adenosylmethionine mitochondrial carrier protein-like isoform X1 [Dinoponera quadriceps]XP_014484907.1 PREDICTED: S-adenosylmethionine mitochondrial carrier protein-like isoform X1 [Dinoponera quadriceps]XP_014484908.1 PREDICTED: S-adenosylmethionine mitochondrial carrier protein-like isoform X1 [Dinoponera quadriceps]